MLRYLIDENVDPLYTQQLRRRNAALFVIAIGDLTAPAKGTLDPDILMWCEEHNCVLITNNRRSMPVHLNSHIQQNHHIPGIFILNSSMGFGKMIDHLLLVAEGSFDDEYQDQIVFLPLF